MKDIACATVATAQFGSGPPTNFVNPLTRSLESWGVNGRRMLKQFIKTPFDFSKTKRATLASSIQESQTLCK